MHNHSDKYHKKEQIFPGHLQNLVSVCLGKAMRRLCEFARLVTEVGAKISTRL